MNYAWGHIIHLFCAFVFVGAVFFEVLILESARKQVPEHYMVAIQQGIMQRARKVMPLVVATLFISGIYMASHYLNSKENWFSSSFSTLLTLKIIVACSVLIHFITAITLSIRGKMRSRYFKFIHLSVFTHMIFIVLLAKGMFYFRW